MMRASDVKLAAALYEAGLPQHAKKAEEGYFNEFFGPLDCALLTLMHELIVVGTPAARKLWECVVAGEFDAGKEESDEWMMSAQGQAALGVLFRGE